MRKFQLFCSSALLGFGLFHIVTGFTSFDLTQLDAAWFIGSGLAIILLAFLNILIRHLPHDTTIFRLGQTGNLLFVGLVIWIDYLTLMVTGFILLAIVASLLLVNWRAKISN